MVRVSLAVCLLLAAAPNCPDLYSIATHGFSVPSIGGADAVAVTDPAGVRVTVHFTATNPNPYPITLSSVDYTVALQGEIVFSGTQTDPSVPEHGSRTLDLVGVISPSSQAYRSLRPNETAAYSITGTAHVNSPAGVPVAVEFQDNGTFVVPGNLPAP